MRRTRGRIVHVETLDDLDARLAAGATTLNGWRLHGVDLTDRVDALLERRVGGPRSWAAASPTVTSSGWRRPADWCSRR